MSHLLFLFLCRGADPQAIDRDGRTALQYADSGTSDEDIIVLLEDHSR
jgi:Arf-GAP with coiled-coil, ANK repeat and PH domain-containing protein